MEYVLWSIVCLIVTSCLNVCYRCRKTPYTDAEIKVCSLIHISSHVTIGLELKLLLSVSMKYFFIQVVGCEPYYLWSQTAFQSKAKQFHPDQNQNNKGRTIEDDRA